METRTNAPFSGTELPSRLLTDVRNWKQAIWPLLTSFQRPKFYSFYK